MHSKITFKSCGVGAEVVSRSSPLIVSAFAQMIGVEGGVGFANGGGGATGVADAGAATVVESEGNGGGGVAAGGGVGSKLPASSRSSKSRAPTSLALITRDCQ